MDTLKPFRPCESSVGSLASAGCVSGLSVVTAKALTAGGDLAGGVGGLVAHDVHLAAEQVVHRRCRALVGHGGHVDLQALLQQQAAQVRCGAQAGIGQVDLALVGFQPGHQFGVVAAGSPGRPITVMGTSLTMPRYSKSSSVR
jgi:hypothetical protein